MSKGDGSNTHQVMEQVFRAMDVKMGLRATSDVPPYANQVFTVSSFQSSEPVKAGANLWEVRTRAWIVQLMRRGVPEMRMQVFVFATVLAMCVPLSKAQQQSSDEAAIRAVLARETDGWNKFDPSEVASTFTIDAIWQNPFGVRLHGRTEILKFLTDLLARPGYRAGTSTTPTKILDLRLTSPTTAAVWSDEKIEGLVNDFSGRPMQPRHSYYLKVLVKQAREWKISDALIMDIVHPQ